MASTAIERAPAGGTFLTPAQVAELLQTDTREVRRLVALGKLPAPVRLTPRFVRYDAREVFEWLEERKKRGG